MYIFLKISHFEALSILAMSTNLRSNDCMEVQIIIVVNGINFQIKKIQRSQNEYLLEYNQLGVLCITPLRTKFTIPLFVLNMYLQAYPMAVDEVKKGNIKAD